MKASARYGMTRRRNAMRRARGLAALGAALLYSVATARGAELPAGKFVLATRDEVGGHYFI